MPDALIPRLFFRAVEDDEVAFVYRAYSIHIISRLLQALVNSPLKAVAFDFQFEHDALHRAAIPIRKRFTDEQVGALTPQAILTVNITTAIYNAL